MDLNLVVLCGRMHSDPELRVFESGSRLLRMFLSIRSEQPRSRVDVLPIVLWDPPEELLEHLPLPGDRVWVSGRVQRRFWEDPEGRRSSLDIVAEQVTVRELEEPADVEG